MNLSQNQLLPKLRTALEKIKLDNEKLFYAWKITIQYFESHQTLMVGKSTNHFEKYQNRKVLDLSYAIDVYTRHGDPMVMGNSHFVIDPLEDLEKQVLKTFKNSLLVGNKPWDLPTKLNGKYEKVCTIDPIIAESLEHAHQKMIAEINAKINNINTVNFNSGELFTNLKTYYFETSFGLSGQKENSDVYFEIAIEKLPLPNTQEVLKYKKAISIEDANLSKFIDEAVLETLSITNAEIPKTSEDCHILIDGDSISSLLNHVVSQLNAQREYDKSPFLTSGDSILEGNKKIGSDKLNIALDPSLPVMALSTPFTNEGMKPMKAEIIKDDLVTTQLINNRVGQYLGKTPNFIEGNLLVKVGTKSKEELLKSSDECMEIIAFSSLLINPNTLTWSSEIKLAKLHKKGQHVCMLKGGVVSGNIKENFIDFNFGKEEVKINEVSSGFSPPKGYVGPNCMLIKSGVKVVGA